MEAGEVAGLTHGTIKVSVADVRMEHEVKMTEFTKWLDRPDAARDDSAAKGSFAIGNAGQASVNVIG